MEKQLAAIGIRRKGESSFKITTLPHLIHTSNNVRACSNCGSPVSGNSCSKCSGKDKMTTPEELATEIMDQVITHRDSINFDSNELYLEIVERCEKFEDETRKNERINQIKKIKSMGEFKTFGEAREYCRLHGLHDSHVFNNAMQIAGALLDARKDERRKKKTLKTP